MGVGEQISALHRGDILNDHAPLAVGGSVCGLLYVKLCYVKLGALGVLGIKYLVQYVVQYQVLGTKCFAFSS